jgi:hypothetical protein
MSAKIITAILTIAFISYSLCVSPTIKSKYSYSSQYTIQADTIKEIVFKKKIQPMHIDTKKMHKDSTYKRLEKNDKLLKNQPIDSIIIIKKK